MIKNPPAMWEDLSSVPGLGRSPGEGNGNPLRYSCLENPMDRGAGWAVVHGAAQGQTGRVTDASAFSPFTASHVANTIPHFIICQP